MFNLQQNCSAVKCNIQYVDHNMKLFSQLRTQIQALEPKVSSQATLYSSSSFLQNKNNHLNNPCRDLFIQLYVAIQPKLNKLKVYAWCMGSHQHQIYEGKDLENHHVDHVVKHLLG